MSRKKLLILLCAAVALSALCLVLAFVWKPSAPEPAPAAATAPTPADMQIGICLPDNSDPWVNTGKILQQKLLEKGYNVTVVEGDGTAQTQDSLLQELIAKPVNCIITAPVDSAALTATAATASQKNIPILSYGSLLMDTGAATGYICYDYYEMGVSIARYIEQKLSLPSAEQEARHYTVELFMGAAEDYNALQLHKGMISVLEPYMQKGVLESGSRRTAFEDSCIYGWSEEAAESACNNRLKNHYRKKLPDICICASDSIAAGVIAALEKAGANPENMPLVTGNGATEAGNALVENGKLAVTIATDPAAPADACCAMVEYALFGQVPKFALLSTFNNVVGVPTAKCGFTMIEGE